MFTLTLRFVTFMLLNFKKEFVLTEQFLRRLSKLQVPLLFSLFKVFSRNTLTAKKQRLKMQAKILCI